MSNARFRLFKPMTLEQLRKNDRVLLFVVLVGGFFLMSDLYRSVRIGVPKLGIIGYITGPIFAHKISEILLLLLWLPVVWVSNYEMSGLYPTRMPPERYYRLLRFLLFLAPLQVILATYSWTIVNLGTSPLTTNYQPLIFGEDGWVWRYYLAAVIIAGAAYIPFAARKVVALAVQLPKG